MSNYAIEAVQLSKTYALKGKSEEGDGLWRSFLGNRTLFYALRDISFTVKPGEALGLVGLNGSGKTTLSNQIARVSLPSSGAIRVRGAVSMVSMRAGLSPHLTGVENVEQKGLLLGMKRQEIRELIPMVRKFAQLGDFMDQPIRTYSSGMRARLAFAISVNVDPDILVIDEGLSAGDTTFVERCHERIQRFHAEGKTTVFTSHSAEQMRMFCSRLIWLESGRIRMDGEVNEVIREYRSFLKWFKSLSGEEQSAYSREKREDRIVKISR